VHALLLAFLSGAPALVYQVVWTREVALLAGVQMDSIATVVAAFFGGLALGSRALGARVDASERPLRFYGLLEIAAALLALVATLALRALDAHGPASGAAMLAACAAAMFPVTFLLGGTQPALLRSTGALAARAAAPAGAIQGVNTVGAVLGVAAAAFAIPSLGLWATLVAGAAGATLVGLLALFFDRRTPSAARPAPALDSDRSALPGTLLALAAAAGFATLAFEVLSARMAALHLGSSLFAWALVLATFLVGLGTGNLASAQRASASERPLALLAAIEVACAASIAAGLALLTPPLARGSAGVAFGPVLSVALGTLPPAFFMGAAFPVFARLVIDSSPGRSFGALAAWNTAGGIAGSLAAPLALLPMFGLVGGAVACALINLGVALVAHARAARAERDALPFERAAARAVAIVAVSIAFGAWVSAQRQPPGAIHVEHGRHATAVVVDHQGERELVVDGDSEAFTGGVARRTEELLAAIPLALHPAPRRFLEIGFGAGITLGAAARFPLERIECVEISDEVLRAGPFLEPANRAVLRNPDLVVHHRDARAFLRSRREPSDVVVANTLHPWSLGATGLYSREYFVRLAGAVADDGLATQWIPAERIAGASFRSIARTFFSVFEHGAVFWGARNVILVGSHAPLSLPTDGELARRLEPAGFALGSLGLARPDGDPLRDRFIASAQDVRRTFGRHEVLRDDVPRLELDAARGEAPNDAEIFASLVELARAARGEGEEPGALELWLESRRLRELGEEAAAEVLAESALQGGLAAAKAERAERSARSGSEAHRAGDAARAAQHFRDALALDPGHRGAALGLVGLDQERGDRSGAAARLRDWLAREPADAGAWVHLASIEAERGDVAAAARAIANAREANPFFPKAIANAGLLALARGDDAAVRDAIDRLRALRAGDEASRLEAERARFARGSR